jgi:hypothetical protein
MKEAQMQNTAEWNADRLQRLTSSRFGDLMSNGRNKLYRFKPKGEWFYMSDRKTDKETPKEMAFELFPEIEFTFFDEKGKTWVTHESFGGEKFNLNAATGLDGFMKAVGNAFCDSRVEMGETAKSYILEKAYEIATGEAQGFGGNDYTDWGHEYEPFARAEYTLATGVEVDSIGFCCHPTLHRVGGSPDGLVGNDGIIEIKCPANGLNHARNVLSDTFLSTYEWQPHANMWVTGRKWCDMVSYDPRLKDKGKHLHIVRVHRDEAKIAQMKARVEEATELLETYLTMLGYVEEVGEW